MSGEENRWIRIAAVVVCIAVFGAAATRLTLLASSWWRNDRVHLLGRSVDEQRRAVLETYDLDTSIIEGARAAASVWPLETRYRIEKRDPRSSYLEYLLAPRVPVPESTYSVDLEGPAMEFTPDRGGPVEPIRSGSPLGIVGSILTVFGCGSLLSRAAGWGRRSPPQVCLLGCVVIAVCVLAAKGMLGSGVWGMRVAMTAGLTGLAATAWEVVRGRRYLAMPPRLPPIAVSAVIPLGISLLYAGIGVPDEWDAWAIWGPKAKLLALGVGPLSDITRFTWADYPLAWPSIWAYTSWLSNGWEERWVGCWGTTFLALTAWEAAHISARLADNRRAGLVTGLVVVSMPLATLISSWRYAEPLLWLFLVGGVSALIELHRQPSSRRAALVGTLAAGAALTKNEGLLFAALVGVWLLWFGGRAMRRHLVWFAAPLALLVGPWFVWTRVVLRLSTHAAFVPTPRHLAGALQRIPGMLSALVDATLEVPVESLVLLLVLGTAALLWRQERALPAAILALPVAMYAAFLAILLFHRLEIEWLVWSAWPRLLLQPLPIMVACTVAWTFQEGAKRDPWFVSKSSAQS